MQLDPDIEGPDNGFAFDVAISADGSRLVVDGTGDVVTFDWDDSLSSWVEADRTNPAGATALSGDGNRLVTDGGPGIATFDWDDSSSSWVRVAETSAFAYSMALSRSGDRLVISDGGGDFGYDGTVAVFDWEDASASWVQVGSVLNGADGDIFGDSVDIAADGGVIAVGAPDGGYVRVFEVAEESSTTTTIPSTTQPPVTVLPETGGSTTTTITIVSVGLVVSGLTMLGATRRRSSTRLRDR